MLVDVEVEDLSALFDEEAATQQDSQPVTHFEGSVEFLKSASGVPDMAASVITPSYASVEDLAPPMNELEISAYSYDHEKLLKFTSDTKTIGNEESQNVIMQLSQDELTSFNLGTNEEPREIQISNALNKREWDSITEVLKQHEKVFAWSYDDMPGIDREIDPFCWSSFKGVFVRFVYATIYILI